MQFPLVKSPKLAYTYPIFHARREEMTMQLITVRDLFKNTEKYVDQEIEIGGWVRNKRPSKQFGFIVLNDGTYFTPVQVVYNDSI